MRVVKMTKHNGKAFIDANILIYAHSYKNVDAFEWINQLYKDIYSHKMVLDELLMSGVREKVASFIENEIWTLFDPDDETHLSEEMYSIYNAYVRDVQEAFRELDIKKEKEGRPLKNTNDLGEIHCLAAALLLNATIICSNDHDIKEVIADTPLKITIDEEKDSILIQRDTLEDFCCDVIQYNIEKRSIVRKFFKATQPERLERLDKRLQDFDEKH